jgi:hypothetical protein
MNNIFSEIEKRAVLELAIRQALANVVPSAETFNANQRMAFFCGVREAERAVLALVQEQAGA